MKKALFILLALCSLVVAGPARAWNCSDPLAARVPVATGTSGTYGDGDGQLFLGVSGQGTPGVLYECEVPPSTPPTTTGGNSNATSTSNSNSSSAANSASSSSATGGKSSSTSAATGGNATGGNATGGSSNASVSASGNSNVTNNVNATGGMGGSGGNGGNSTATGGNQKQTQSQTLANSGNSTATASGNGVGNGNNSDNSSTTINDERSVASAYAPSMSATASCFKPYSGGGQGLLFGASFGSGKIDQNCAALEASRQAPSIIARCKIFLTVKYAKEAGVTMDDCMPQLRVPIPPVLPTVLVPPAPQLLAPITVNVPAPVVTVIPAPVMAPTPSVAVAAAATHHKAHVPCEPVRVPSGKNGCVVTNGTINK